MSKVTLKMSDEKIPVLCNYKDAESHLRQASSDLNAPWDEYKRKGVPILHYPGTFYMTSSPSIIDRVSFGDNYKEFKRSIRKNAHYAHIEGLSILDEKNLEPIEIFKDIDGQTWTPSEEAANFINASKKASFQIWLERQIVNHEEQMLHNFTEHPIDTPPDLRKKKIDVWRVDVEEVFSLD
jgi:hypothetical protein